MLILSSSIQKWKSQNFELDLFLCVFNLYVDWFLLYFPRDLIQVQGWFRLHWACMRGRWGLCPDKVSYVEKFHKMEEVNQTHCVSRCSSPFFNKNSSLNISWAVFLALSFASNKMASAFKSTPQIECKAPHAHLGPVWQSGTCWTFAELHTTYRSWNNSSLLHEQQTLLPYWTLFMVFFQDVLWAQKLEKVEEMTGAEMQEEEMEPEGEALVGLEGEALRPPGIMVYSPPLFLTSLFWQVSGQQTPCSFLSVLRSSSDH